MWGFLWQNETYKRYLYYNNKRIYKNLLEHWFMWGFLWQNQTNKKKVHVFFLIMWVLIFKIIMKILKKYK